MTARERDAFLSRLPYTPDPFQIRAFDALDAGHSVLVSAPTGSGKTLVANYAVEQAVKAKQKAFYTTPLKALSNQKYGELADIYGQHQVGLLTGDISRRADAPVVVMTTEVLRNMLLTGSELLDGLTVVVLDEVHYLQDPYRGGVWEEVIVLAPADVMMVCLSATVANAAELGAWLETVRGPTDLVIERTRPITLRHHFALTERGGDYPEILPLLDDRQPSKEAHRVDERARRAARQGAARQSYGADRRRLSPYLTPRRAELAQQLDESGLLPAIEFIFSRAACDDAVRQLLRAGLRFTKPKQRSQIRAIADERVDPISDDELRVLGYPEWLTALECGIAAHHAGLVPAFRETVEVCFAAGLLQLVFATETLSLGINMPARTVVIERFSKFGGAGREPLTSGDYAQLTGRAGRRGLDEEGHATVLWSPDVPVVRMAQVAAGEPPALRSSFRPTYNLAVNLVQRFDRDHALVVLRRSFAQWQHDNAMAQEHSSLHRSSGGYLSDLLGRRLAVLEELGYVHGWSVTDGGVLLARIYHEADLIVAECLRNDLLDTEPAVLAGVLSALVFEPRRSQRIQGSGRVAARSSGRWRAGDRRERHGGRGPRKQRDPGRQLGERRRQDLQDRLRQLDVISERVRALEEVHRVPPSRRNAGHLAEAVASWARGVGLGTVLEIARHEGIELAPGDFVRMIKQLADLVGQLAAAAPHPATAAAAQESIRQLVRGVVAAGEPAASPASHTGLTPPS